MNWGDVKSLANGFIHRSDQDWSLFQPLAMDEINGALVVQDNEAATTLALTPATVAGWNTVTLPPDFAAMRAVMNGTQELDPIDIKGLLAQPGSGKWYAISGGLLWAAQTSLTAIYSARIANLVADADHNTLTDKYSGVLLYGLLKHATGKLQDFEAQEGHAAQFASLIGDANAAYAMSVSAGSMSRTPYAVVSN